MNAAGQDNLQHLFKCLHFLGLSEVYVCPGSRNAPLIHAAFHTQGLHLHKVVDERSAAYQALGSALLLQKPVAIICTSGTALLNVLPAIAEAFQLQVPLIVMSADRPLSLYDKWENQTIHQEGVLGRFVNTFMAWKGQLLRKRSIGKVERFAAKAMDYVQFPDNAPIHLNFHFDEPIYFAKKAKDYPIFSLTHHKSRFSLKTFPSIILPETPSVLIVAGQGHWNDTVASSIENLLSKGAVLFCDVCSPYRKLQTDMRWEFALSFLSEADWEALLPDTLVITGAFVVNKNLKKLIKKGGFKNVFQLADRQQLKDPYELKPQIVSYIKQETSETWPYQQNLLFKEKWCNKIAAFVSNPFLPDNLPFSDWFIVSKIKDCLTTACVIHAANSMAVRYVSMVGLNKEIKILSNRGTSGIDGCLSTAMGAAWVDPKQKHIAIIGDLAFFYDQNALWREQLPPNLTILVLNNGGGNIFDMIPGPATSPAYHFFTTPHSLSAALVAKQFDINYTLIDNSKDLEMHLHNKLQSNTINLIEFITNPKENKEIWKQLKIQKENG
jgi:2-succinyl-5-enolpyruvyl-6-hydroxy-3-cyclohexene-1-carboxylate synthase